MLDNIEQENLVALAADSVTNFSAAPLRLATWLGLISFFFCLLLMVIGVVVYASGLTVPGWASIFVAVLLRRNFVVRI